jgi:SAM-dependent methyltransferase
MIQDTTLRFSNRVANYVKYRPGYPVQVLDYLQQQCNLTSKIVIADIGSGTGIFTKLLLDRGYTVYAVEPNEAMRLEADRQLKHQPNYHSIGGTVVCAQAFHWFNSPQTKAEFKRILRPDGWVALIWNNRRADADDFAIAYDLLLKKQSNDYEQVNHQNLTKTDFENFYSDGKYQLVKFRNEQVFNLEQLTGRAFSSSYLPAQDTDAGKKLSVLLKELFDWYQTDGNVTFRYDTEVYLGMV